jgi:hypothetical protein
VVALTENHEFLQQIDDVKTHDDPTMDHVFVIGHKPILGEEGDGETISPSQVEELTEMLCEPMVITAVPRCVGISRPVPTIGSRIWWIAWPRAGRGVGGTGRHDWI